MSEQKTKYDLSLIELLLALAILSVSLYPIVHIAHIYSLPAVDSNDNLQATMLAHHVMETIKTQRANDSHYLPSQASDFQKIVAEYFAKVFQCSEARRENQDLLLKTALDKYKCSIDTYFLDEKLFKVIVYVTYKKDGRNRKVFFERLFTQKNLYFGEEENEEEE